MPSLLDLPPELRVTIYEELLSDTTYVNPRRKDKEACCPFHYLPPTISRVCRKMRQESLPAAVTLSLYDVRVDVVAQESNKGAGKVEFGWHCPLGGEQSGFCKPCKACRTGNENCPVGDVIIGGSPGDWVVNDVTRHVSSVTLKLISVSHGRHLGYLHVHETHVGATLPVWTRIISMDSLEMWPDAEAAKLKSWQAVMESWVTAERAKDTYAGITPQFLEALLAKFVDTVSPEWKWVRSNRIFWKLF
ncbi:hypothetical protein M8818_004327 [Zalaria obscura]|uniref:Uncharacterized protein n=1 Tax=Zalaria obscura TaxID=2024903 RepID=A0ACC3SF72_9PEZI